MKKLTAFLPIHLCFLLALALGISAHAPAAMLTEGPFLLQQAAIRGERVVPASSVWVEAVFVETSESTIRDLEEALGFKLNPVDGKVVLTPEEKEKLLALVEENESASVIASLVIVTTSGQEAHSEDVEQVIFPTEFDTETIQIGGSEGTTNLIPGEVFMVTPGNWEVRDVGTILNVTPTVSDDGKTITLALAPEMTQLVDWINYGNDVYPIFQPIFRSWSKTTTITIPDGASFVLKEWPRAPFKPAGRKLGESPRPPTKARRPAGATKERESQLTEDTQEADVKPLLQSLEGMQAQLRTELQESVEKLSRVRRKFALDLQGQPVQFQRRELLLQKKDLVGAEIAKLRAFVAVFSDMSTDERVNAVQDNAAVYQLSAEVAKQEAMRSALLEEYGEEHPLVKAQTKSIASLEQRLHGLVNGVLEAKKAELASLEEQEKALGEYLRDLEKEMTEIERQLPELKALTEEVEATRAALLKLEKEASVMEKSKRKPREPRPAEGPSPEREEILKKLNTLIPKVEFEDASLKDLVDFFTRECGVNIVIDPAVFQPPSTGAAKESGITVTLRNVPLKEALKYVLRYKNLEYLVEDLAVVIVPVGWRAPEDGVPVPVDRTSLLTIISAKTAQ